MVTPSEPSPQEDDELVGLLRKEAGFARKLARSLLFDEQLADDVVQQAWLTAIEHPPAHRRSLRGWFLTVVRNLALKALRSRQRRSARERGAALAESVESTAQSVEREHVLRSMTDAVLALDEPYRHTILARFFDDLPPRVIAAQDGVPIPTVQSRITRGLAKLREKLDHDQGGAPSSRMALGLLAFADPAWFAALTGGGGSGALKTTGEGGHTLSTGSASGSSTAPWLVPVAVASTALVVVTLLFFLGDDAPAPIDVDVAPRARAPPRPATRCDRGRPRCR